MAINRSGTSGNRQIWMGIHSVNKYLLEYIANSRFSAVVNMCLDEEEFIQQFERLSGIHRPPSRKSPIEVMVDEATGFNQSQWQKFFEGFIQFVYEFVWLRWPEREGERCWTSTQQNC